MVFEKSGLKMSPENIKIVMGIMDKDKDGALDFEEFYQLSYVIFNFAITNHQLMRFLVHDTNQNGTLELSELVKLFEQNGIKATEASLRGFFEAQLQRENLENVEFEEFVQVLNKLE